MITGFTKTGKQQRSINNQKENLGLKGAKQFF
jgi:hypothetical protein